MYADIQSDLSRLAATGATTPAQLAKVLGVSRTRVSKRLDDLRKVGVHMPARPTAASGKPLSASGLDRAQTSAIVQAALEGLEPVEIAERVGVSKLSVMRRLLSTQEGDGLGLWPYERRNANATN